MMRASELFGVIACRGVRSVFAGIMGEDQILAGSGLYWSALVELFRRYGV